MTLRTTRAHDDSAESRAAKLFLSHSTQDDTIVRALQRALCDLGQDVWSNARELRDGDPLSSEIQQAIEQAAGYAVVISSASLQSRWVGKELRHALEVQRQNQRDGKRYAVIPLLLDDATLGVLESYFDEEPLCVPLGSAAGGVEAALHPILVALGKREPADVAATPELLHDGDSFPGHPEQSLFASVELSLRRLSPENRDRARVLGLFHGGVDLDALSAMMDWDEAEVEQLAGDLIDTGLATPNRYNHLSLDPALCPYLRRTLDDAGRAALTPRWVDAMRGYVNLLCEQSSKRAELAATLTLLELPNLLVLLAHVSRVEDAEATVHLATRLHFLLSLLGRPRLLARVAATRDAAAARLGSAWNHARFGAARGRIEDQLAGGQLREALAGAQRLLRKARADGEQAYPGADYDLAMACRFLGRVLKATGSPRQALRCLDDAQRRFEAIAQAQSVRAAAGMASRCFADKGVCLRDLGRLDDAAAAYEECTRRAEQQSDERQLALAKGQLGTVRLLQCRHQDALDAYAEARAHFARLGEPRSVACSVAVIWYQTGHAYLAAGQLEAAEDAYRRSLALKMQLGDVGGQARTLSALGALYGDLDRLEEAASLFRQAAELVVAIGDAQAEGRCWNNLGDTLRKLGRWDEARQAIRRAIEGKEPFGHAAEPWSSWAVLAGIEAGVGNAGAAAQARAKAIACYLAYRRDGGENHHADGRISLAVTEKLRAGDAAGAASFLDELSAHSELPDWLRPFVTALQAIAAGRRDRSLAEAPELHYRPAAELRVLLDLLEEEEAES